jgi:hypothetical protein
MLVIYIVVTVNRVSVLMTAPTTTLIRMLWWRFLVKAKDSDLNSAQAQ